MSAPEQQAAPVQPPADLRQRIDATIRPRMLIGLQDAELYDQPGRERIGEWADSITSWVMAEVEPELAKRQERGDIWKAKAQEMEQDRDRLAAELAALDQRVTLLRAGALERSALLEEARDALEAAGQTGAHGDDWPAIAPAIRTLAAENARLRGDLAVAEAARDAAAEAAHQAIYHHGNLGPCPYPTTCPASAPTT